MSAEMPSGQVTGAMTPKGEQHEAKFIQTGSQKKEQSLIETHQSKHEPVSTEQSTNISNQSTDDNLSAHDLLLQAIDDFHRGPEFLAKRREVGKLRLQQSKAYLDLLESRLSVLEEQFRQSNLTICQLSWFEFRGKPRVYPRIHSTFWKHSPEIDSDPKSMIEILIEEPTYNLVRSIKWRRSLRDDDDPAFGGTAEDIDPSSAIVSSTSQSDNSTPHLIRIRSPLLLKVLKDVTGIETTSGPHQHILVFFKPFKLLVANEARIRARLKSLSHKAGPEKETETKEAKESLHLLCSVLDQYLQPKINFRSHASPLPSTIAFEDLWYLFKTGDEVRTTGKHQIQMFRVLKVTGGRDILQEWSKAPSNHASTKLKAEGYSPGSFIIECFFIHYDGVRYGPVNETFQIPKFHGERDISSLPIMPLHYDTQCTYMREALLKRGDEFAKLCSPAQVAHKRYQGLTLDKRQHQVHSEIIVDFRLAFIELPESRPVIGIDDLVDDDPRELGDMWRREKPCDRPGCCGNDLIFSDYIVDEQERKDFKASNRSLLDPQWKVEALTDDHKRLLPPRIYGFVLRTRKWATFDIDLIREVRYTKGWNRLVIDKLTKDTILALVETHQNSDNVNLSNGNDASSVDLVQGKGKGLIILLHGEPGVGKTSTAECVADYTKRPLFAVTCGDIGDNPRLVETNLERNFQLAHKWGCVLLLDEADIFLSKRDNNDITRNAIVSAQQGILFLTTNRVGTIDRAFKSRIHMSLYYPKLDLKKSLSIWQNSIDTLKAEMSGSIKVDDDAVLKFAKKQYRRLEKEDLRPWNGRQIRNAFQTAIAIAKYDGKEKNMEVILRAEHFKKVAKSAVAFDQYLTEIYSGKDEAQLARESYLRADDWGGFPVLASQAVPIEPYRRARGRDKKPSAHAQPSDSEASSSTSSDDDDDSSSINREGGTITHKSSKRSRASSTGSRDSETGHAKRKRVANRKR
ncbi:P-loop containing nucleoside triphosphate hydrolase protein [Nemania sp. FL0916]|nr:P-loop containing nucleoside triphosphate hydrolase protein [Nemania sp. FL0916]